MDRSVSNNEMFSHVSTFHPQVGSKKPLREEVHETPPSPLPNSHTIPPLLLPPFTFHALLLSPLPSLSIPHPSPLSLALTLYPTAFSSLPRPYSLSHTLLLSLGTAPLFSRCATQTINVARKKVIKA